MMRDVQIIEHNDKKLIELTKSGEIEAYSVLVQRYGSSVRACLRSRLSNSHEAEDLAQETFILAYDKLNDFNYDASFKGWLRSIAINLLRNHQRKLKALAIGGSAELELLIDQQVEQHLNQNNESELLEYLHLCLNALDHKMRTLLTEHYTLGFSLAELCRKYEDRHSAMTMRMYRLRQKLKNCVENKMKD
ncbi:RNA polymerase sigma factor [Colwellia sp. RE-S-Sl-9]